MKEYILKSEKGEVHYWYSDVGSDTTLVFLHGLTANHHLFDKQLEYFEGRYNCLAWDAPAHGESRPYADFTYPNAAAELLAILDRHGIEKPVLIGQSMGGYVAQSFLLRNPGRAAAFISIDSSPYGEQYYSASDKWWLKQIEWMSACYPEKALKKAVAKQCTAAVRSEENMLSMLNGYAKTELCHLMGIGYAGFLEDNQNMELSCPLLLIAGKKDITGKVKAYNRQWSDVTGVPVHWVENAAHNSNDDAPEAVNALIEEFIRSLNQGGTA